MTPLLDDYMADEELGPDAGFGLGGALADALGDEYADAMPYDLDAAALQMLDSMTPAESLNFASALRQIEKGATQALRNPAVGQIASTGLPILGGAAGTLVGGPLGTALGGQLGSAAAKAITGGAPAVPGAPAPTAPAVAQAPAVTGGSTAAAQAMVLSQQPEVLKSLLALALGQYGRQSVAGVPVGSVMGALSSIFGQAAADAEALGMNGDGLPDYLLDAEGELSADPGSPYARAQAFYSALVEAENDYLASGGAP